MKLTVKAGSDPSLSDAKYVIDVTISGATLSKGTVKVTIPFSNEIPKGKIAKVYYISGDEKIDMNATFSGDKVVFVTDHFSKYAIYYEDDPNAPSSSGNTMLFIGIGVAAFIAIAGAVAFIVIKKHH